MDIVNFAEDSNVCQTLAKFCQKQTRECGSTRIPVTTQSWWCCRASLLPYPLQAVNTQ